MPRTRGRSEAKHSILWALGLFAVSTLVLNVVIDRSVSLRRPDWGARERQIQSFPPAARPQVAMIGTSRTQCLRFDFEDVGTATVHNNGLPWARPAMQHVTLRRRLALEPRPAAILIEFGAPFVAESPPEDLVPPESLSFHEAAFYAQYVESRATWWTRWGRTRLGAFYTYQLRIRSGITRRLFPNEGNVDPSSDSITTERRLRGFAQARREYATVLQGWSVRPWWDCAFRDLLRACREAGIPFAVYRMPESPAFRAMYRPGADAEARAYAAAVCHDFGVSFFDGWQWFNSEEDFYDGHHLAPRAASEFRSRFFADLALWLNVSLPR